MLKRKRTPKRYTYKDLKTAFIGHSIIHFLFLLLLFIKDLATSNVFVLILISSFIIKMFNIYSGFDAAEKSAEEERNMTGY